MNVIAEVRTETLTAFSNFTNSFKVIPEGIMVDMASKNSSSCTVSYTSPPMKTDLLYLRSPKGGCCLISDALCCSCTETYIILLSNVIEIMYRSN